MSDKDLPILYSFRRCPYAMRARLAIAAAGVDVVLREVVLRDKPTQMLEISPKGTVPVLQQSDGTVLEESYDIMHWALGLSDPDGWMPDDHAALDALVKENDGPFKSHLDRYKYATRYEGADAETERNGAMRFLLKLNEILREQPFLHGQRFGFADAAIAPFVRQFANADRAWFEAQPIPNVIAWVTAFMESESFKAIMPKLPQWQKGDVITYFPFKSAV